MVEEVHPAADTPKSKNIRQVQSEYNDKILLQHIKYFPGKTSVELEEIFRQNRFKFERSYLINALVRLERDKKIISKQVLSDKKIVNRYYINYDEGSSVNVIEIVSPLFKSEDWGQTAHLYALSNNEIKISPHENNELAMLSFASYKVETEIRKGNLFISLPKRVTRFYRITPQNLDTDIEGATVTIKITPEKKKAASEKRVLILEDDPFWLDYIANKFLSAGHTVFKATSAKEAYTHLDKNVNFLVLDWKLNGQLIEEDVFSRFRNLNKDMRGSLITEQAISPEKWKEFTKFGFVSIIPKHPVAGMDACSIDDIANEQLSVLEMS